MTDTVALRRTTVALALPAAALTSIAWTALMPPFPDGAVQQLTAIDEAGASATASAVLFCASQYVMLVALLGVARLARRRSPRLATVGGALGVIGCLGHAVWGGVSLLTLQLAADAGNRVAFAGAVERLESSPVMVFAASGLLGTVLGFLLLGIALVRSRAVPTWVPTLLFGFLVLEFLGSGLSDWAGYAAGVCLLVAFGALGHAAWRSPDSTWALATPVVEPETRRRDVGASA